MSANAELDAYAAEASRDMHDFDQLPSGLRLLLQRASEKVPSRYALGLYRALGEQGAIDAISMQLRREIGVVFGLRITPPLP